MCLIEDEKPLGFKARFFQSLKGAKTPFKAGCKQTLALSQDVFLFHQALDLLALLTKIANDGGKSVLFDKSHRGGAELEGDKSIFLRKPQALDLDIRKEATRRLPRYLNTNALFLFRNTARDVRKPSRGALSSNLTYL
jgi:hypothetical protein